MAENKVHDWSPNLLKLWLGLHFAGGHVGIPILLLTLATSSLKRLPTLYGLLCTWVFTSVVSCLLAYAGRAMPDDPQPNLQLCLMQASFIYGAPVMTAFSAFGLVYEGWLTVSGRSPFVGTDKFRLKIRTAILLTLPWFGLLAGAIPTFVTGFVHREGVTRVRKFFYCSVGHGDLSNLLGIAVLIILSISALYAARAAVVLRRNWLSFKRRVADSEAPEARMSSPHTAIRIAIFGFYVVFACALSIVSFVSSQSPLPDVFIATFPIAVFLIFGTQEDIIRIWVNLLPSFLKPRSWTNQTNAILPTVTLSPSPSPTAISEMRGALPKSPNTPSNSYNVWKEKYLDPSLVVPVRPTSYDPRASAWSGGHPYGVFDGGHGTGHGGEAVV